jgi:hypothetical protein
MREDRTMSDTTTTSGPLITLATARRDHQIGYLTQWRIVRSPDGAGWRLLLGKGNAAAWLRGARTAEPRTFTTLDGVVSTLATIGFEVVELGQ